MIEHLAVVGATGAVGREFLDLVGQRSLPAKRLTLLASERSAGLCCRVCDTDVTVQPLSADRLNGVSIAVFCADANISREYAPDHLAGRAMRGSVFPHPIAFNLFAHDSSVEEDGYNGEERKVIAETRKILYEAQHATSDRASEM